MPAGTSSNKLRQRRRRRCSRQLATPATAASAKTQTIAFMSSASAYDAPLRRQAQRQIHVARFEPVRVRPCKRRQTPARNQGSDYEVARLGLGLFVDHV